MRRLAIALLGAAACLAVLAPAGRSADAAPAQPTAADPTPGPVDVLQVSGLFDPIVVDAIDQAIDRSAADGAQALILQVNTRGAVVGRDDIQQLMERIAASKVPVAIWVGPSGARLYGTPAQLLAVADVSGMAPGARVGHIGVAAATERHDGRLRRGRPRRCATGRSACPTPASSACSTSGSPTRASRRSSTWSTPSTATRRATSRCTPPSR